MFVCVWCVFVHLCGRPRRNNSQSPVMAVVRDDVTVSFSVVRVYGVRSYMCIYVCVVRCSLQKIKHGAASAQNDGSVVNNRTHKRSPQQAQGICGSRKNPPQSSEYIHSSFSFMYMLLVAALPQLDSHAVCVCVLCVNRGHHDLSIECAHSTTPNSSVVVYWWWCSGMLSSALVVGTWRSAG